MKKIQIFGLTCLCLEVVRTALEVQIQEEIRLDEFDIQQTETKKETEGETELLCKNFFLSGKVYSKFDNGITIPFWEFIAKVELVCARKRWFVRHIRLDLKSEGDIYKKHDVLPQYDTMCGVMGKINFPYAVDVTDNNGIWKKGSNFKDVEVRDLNLTKTSP